MSSRPNCTASAILPRRAQAGPVPLGVVVALVAVALLPGGLATVRADVELGHTGRTGRHLLADLYDSPGAVCDVVLPGPDSLGETWMRINPPVIYARDRTAGVDEQVVGWTAAISALDPRTGSWNVVQQGEIARDVARDNRASYFQGQGWLARFPVARATFTVAVEMLWYAPDEPARIEGRARHEVEYFTTIVRYNGEVVGNRITSDCRAAQ